VRAYSECWQIGLLEGARIVNYGRTDEIRLLAAHCIECGADVTNDIRE